MPGAVAGVRHGEADLRRLRRADRVRRYAKRVVLERRVAETKAEREQRMASEVEVIIAATGWLVVVDEWQLSLFDRKRYGQPAGRIYRAEHDVSDSVAALLAWIPGHHHGIHPVEPGHGDRAAPDQDDDHRFPCRSDRRNELLLMAGEREFRAVPKLSLLDAGDDDDNIVCARERDRFGDTRAGLVRHAVVPYESQARVTSTLEILQPKVVIPWWEIHIGELRAIRLFAPVVEDQPTVDPEPVAVVTLDPDALHAFGGNAERAGPARGVPVDGNAAPRRTQRPAEVHLAIDSRQARRTRHSIVVEVLALETGTGATRLNEKLVRHDRRRE